MSNRKYRPGGLKGAQQSVNAQENAGANAKESVKDRVLEGADPATSSYEELRDSIRRMGQYARDAKAEEAAERREARADTAGVGATAEAAQAAFHEAVQDATPPEPAEDLSDAQATRILNNLAVMMNHVANLATHAIDEATPELANRVYCEDLLLRASKPERPARPHPLLALKSVVLRCAQMTARLLMVTKPHLFAAAEAAVAKARASHKKVKAAAEKMMGSVQAAAAAASAAAPAPAS